MLTFTGYGLSDSMHQTADMFDDHPAESPIARRTDPKTSHAAAASYSATKRKSHKAILLEAIQRKPHRTANQLREYLVECGHDVMTAHRITNKRTNDLVVDGSIYVSGVTTCPVTGHQCQTYAVVEGSA